MFASADAASVNVVTYVSMIVPATRPLSVFSQPEPTLANLFFKEKKRTPVLLGTNAGQLLHSVSSDCVGASSLSVRLISS